MFCFPSFFKGNPTEWNPDKITSARQAQMWEWSSSLLLITVLWTLTKIKLLHENTEYRQDNLSVYDITSKIMPRIMQVPWCTMDKGKCQVKGSLLRGWRGQWDLRFWGDCFWKLSKLQGTEVIHNDCILEMWGSESFFMTIIIPPYSKKRWFLLNRGPCLHISLRSLKFHLLQHEYQVTGSNTEVLATTYRKRYSSHDTRTTSTVLLIAVLWLYELCQKQQRKF